MVSKGTFPGCWIRCITRVYCPHAVTATHRTPSMEQVHDMQAENTCQMSLCAHRLTHARAHAETDSKFCIFSSISHKQGQSHATYLYACMLKLGCSTELLLDVAGAARVASGDLTLQWLAAKLPGFQIIQQALFSVRAGIQRIGGVKMWGWTREFCLASQHAKLTRETKSRA